MPRARVPRAALGLLAAVAATAADDQGRSTAANTHHLSAHGRINQGEALHHAAPTYSWVFKVEDHGLAYAHMATIEAVHLGSRGGDRLAVAFQASKIKEGAYDQAIWVATAQQPDSPSKTPEWAVKKVVSADGVPVWGPVLATHPSDPATLWLFYSESHNVSASIRPMVGGTVKAIKSSDGGETWGAAQVVLGYTTNNPAYDGASKVTANKPLALPSGDWLLPFWQELPRNASNKSQSLPVPGGAQSNCASVARSTDQGASFAPMGCVDNHYLIENTVGITSPIGSELLMLYRSGSTPLYSSRSTDGGVSWTDAIPTSIPNPNSKVFMYNKPYFPGPLVLAYNPTTHGRTPLALAESTDGGREWRTVVTFDDGSKEYEYPTTVQVNRTAYTVYSAPTSVGIKLAVFQF